LPFGKYKDMADCIAQNQDKDDPGAYCAQIHKDITGKWPSEAHEAMAGGVPPNAMRHSDFQKIYKQFLTHIKDEQEAIHRYNNWIQALNLDETKPYGQSMREQFQWLKKHIDFNLWKEDAQAKYWKVEAGFPLESMNQNVYLEDELYQSARTLKDKIVNLNHKFKLPTVGIVAAQYEQGIVEAVLRVPKALRCPICGENKTINDLIESNGIVNVSLEAVCLYPSETDGACEGMEFTGLALLTKDVLPGIPLTRMMPLEQIMVEALQVDETKTYRRTRKVKRIKMEVLEQDEEPKPRSDAERAKAHFNISDEEWDKLSDEEKQAYIDKLPERGSAEASAATPDDSNADVSHADRGGTRSLKGTMMHPETKTVMGTSVVPDKTRTEDVLTDAPTEVPAAGEQPPILSPPDKPMPKSGEPPEEVPFSPVEPEKETPPEPHICPDGQHYDADANHRYQAEEKARHAKGDALDWEEKHDEIYKKYQQLHGAHRQQEILVQKLHEQKDNAVRDYNNKCVESEKWKRLRDEASGLRDDYMHQLEDTKAKFTDVSRKYNDSLGTNLELSKKLTQAHEDYLEKAAENERLKAAMNKAKSIGKKIVRIKT